MAKKYASDFIKMIEDEKKKYSQPDYVDMLKELKGELEIRIEAERDEQDGELDELSHLM